MSKCDRRRLDRHVFVLRVVSLKLRGIMHPRSPYNQRQTDFDELAEVYPSLRPFVVKSQINFKNPAALRQVSGASDLSIYIRQVTKALLKRDFGLEIKLPDDRLCPPVPNRLNYVLWIQDLLDTSPEHLSIHDTPETKPISGLDIGVGASCIYPLLACTSRPWTMYGTDIDPKSLEFATKNVAINNMQSRIKLVATIPEAPLLPLNLSQIERLDFCMCNPPFYADAAELYSHARSKAVEPFSSCTGSAGEMCTVGGEVAFVTRIIDESLQLRNRIRWYSSMLGKLSSVSALVQYLKDNQIENYALTEFVQGQTRRWGLAWSFLPYRPREDISCPSAYALRLFLPKTPQYHINAPLSSSFTIPLIQRFLTSIQLTQYIWKDDRCIGAVTGNVWSRSARRKGQEPMDNEQAVQVMSGLNGELVRMSSFLRVFVAKSKA